MPSPIDKAEREDLLSALSDVDRTGEALIKAQAAAQIAQSRLSRRVRDLRVKYGARPTEAPDLVTGEWESLPGQSAAPQDVPPLIAEQDPPE